MSQIPVTLPSPIFHKISASELLHPLNIGLIVKYTASDGTKLIDPVDKAEFRLPQTGTLRIGTYGLSWSGMDTKGRKGMLMDIVEYLWHHAVSNALAGSHKRLAECSEELATLHRLPSNPHLELIFRTGSLNGLAYEVRPTDPRASWVVCIFEAPATLGLPSTTPETLMDAQSFTDPDPEFEPIFHSTQAEHIEVLIEERALPLDLLRTNLKQIHDVNLAVDSAFYQGWRAAIETVEQRMTDLVGVQEIPPTYTPKPLPALDPYRESGYEDVNEEFSLTWEGLTAASAPLLGFLRLKLQTWAAQNKVDGWCSNLATDYDWQTVLVAFEDDFKVSRVGTNYVDIEPRESDTALTIRINHDYHFDPDYVDTTTITRKRARS